MSPTFSLSLSTNRMTYSSGARRSTGTQWMQSDGHVSIASWISPSVFSHCPKTRALP